MKYKQITPKAIHYFNNLKQRNIIVDQETGCHNWMGSKDPEGYGQLILYITSIKTISGQTKNINEMFRVHRIVYFIHNPEEDISNKLIRHICDNPSCCNPTHLLSGTEKDNYRDSMNRDRNCVGTRNGSSKMTPAKVRKLRKDRISGMDYTSLAHKYGISRSGACAIVHRIIWKHID